MHVGCVHVALCAMFHIVHACQLQTVTTANYSYSAGTLMQDMQYILSACGLHRQDAAEQQQTMDADEEGRPASGPCRPDFGCCLLHQKLQMLNMCIHSAHRLADVPYVGASSQQVSMCCICCLRSAALTAPCLSGLVGCMCAAW